MAKSVTVSSLVPSFDSAAKAIVSAQAAADKVAVKASIVLTTSIQQFVDACTAAGVPRDKKGADAIAKTIRECQVFLDAVALGTFEKKTITEYGQGAARAFFHNVAFTPSLKNDPAYKIPGKDGAVKTAGSVTTTSDASAQKTARKLLEQLRMLGKDDTAAELLDVLQVAFPDFSESEAADI